MLALVEAFLGQSVLEGSQEWMPERGTPQGAVISPLLSNIYLDPLDHLMAAKGFEMVRYADDFVILCRSPEEAPRRLAAVQQWTAEAGLTLHPTRRGWWTPGRMALTSWATASRRASRLAAREEPGEAQGRRSGRRRSGRWAQALP